MNNVEIFRERAFLAYLLAELEGKTLDEIRVILRCRTREEARRLVARGIRISMEQQK